MKIYISSIKGISKICIIAKDEKTLEKLMGENRSVLYICETTVIFYPDNLKVNISHSEYNMLNQLIDYDVVECQNNGIIYRLYSDSSNDNCIMLTSKCNSNCIMCPCSENSRKYGCLYDMGYLSEWIRHIPTDAEFLTVTGGEPTLLKSDFFTIMQALKDKFERTEFLLLTNGRAFSNKRFLTQFIAVAPENLRVGIPIYAADPLVHDHITQSKGSHEQATRGIVNLLGAGISVEVRIVVSKLNYMHLDKMAEFIISHFPTVTVVNFMGLEMLGNAVKNADEVWIDYTTAFESSKNSIVKLIKNGVDVSLYNFPLCSVEESFWPICKQSISDYKVNYRSECDSCSVKSICGGIFESTLRFCKTEVKPIG